MMSKRSKWYNLRPFNRVFRKKNPVIEMVNMAGGGAAAKEYPYSTNNPAYVQF